MLMVSCNNSGDQTYRMPEFAQVKDVEEIKFLTDDIGVNSVSDIFKYRDCLYLIAYDAHTQTILHAYDIKTGKRIYSAIRYNIIL